MCEGCAGGGVPYSPQCNSRLLCTIVNKAVTWSVFAQGMMSYFSSPHGTCTQGCASDWPELPATARHRLHQAAIIHTPHYTLSLSAIYYCCPLQLFDQVALHLQKAAMSRPMLLTCDLITEMWSLQEGFFVKVMTQQVLHLPWSTWVGLLNVPLNYRLLHINARRKTKRRKVKVGKNHAVFPTGIDCTNSCQIQFNHY